MGRVNWGGHSSAGIDPHRLTQTGTNAEGALSFTRGDLVVRATSTIATGGYRPGIQGSIWNTFILAADDPDELTFTAGEFAIYMGKSYGDLGDCAPGATGDFMLYGLTMALVDNLDATIAIAGLPCAASSATKGMVVNGTATKLSPGVKLLAKTMENVATTTTALVTVLFNGTNGGFGSQA